MLFVPELVCEHPVEAVFGTFEPPDRLDAVCRHCWTAFDVDSMPWDLLARLVDHIRAGHFVPLRSGEHCVSELARDAAGILLFVVWLALPPLCVLLLGRTYLARCRLLYQQLRDHGCECDCCCASRSEPKVGRHALRH